MANMGFTTTGAKLLPDDNTSVEDATAANKDDFEELTTWVVGRLNTWKQHRDTNYETKWNEYERLWQMMWSGSEKQRKSERSKVVTPALSEAVESAVADVEEALFGRGDFFDIKSESDDPEALKQATEHNKVNLKEDLARNGYSLNLSEAVVNGAIFGTGIGEILLKKHTLREPKVNVDETGELSMGVEETEVTYACLQSVNPRNFIIEPNARTIDSALGCAVEEYVGVHIVREGQENGDYRKVKIDVDGGDLTLLPDPQNMSEPMGDKAHMYRYYGLVPKRLLLPEDKVVKLFPDEDEEGTEPASASMIEAIVVIVNKKTCLKAVETPHLMRDRSLVAFPWDIVPGRFWGRGVCEKGATPQKLLDAEFRSRMDALAYTGAPMMAMDAGRLPRGFNMEVYPGKSILTNGDPSTILKPFTFGQVDQNTYEQAKALDQMVQRATGTVNSAQMTQGMGDARPGAVSMSLSGIVKRSKRTLMNIIDRFMLPSLTKIMWRQMQYYPERYIPFNFTFLPSSTMGIMQREYETMQLTQLLQSMDPKSKEYRVALMGILDNTGLTNRAGLIKLLQEAIDRDAAMEQQAVAAAQAQGVDPMQQQLQQTIVALEIAEKQAKIALYNAQAAEQNAKARQLTIQPELDAHEIALKGVYNTPQEQMQAEFDRRMAIADKMLEAEDIASNERIATMQSGGAVEEARIAGAASVLAKPAPVPPAPPNVPSHVSVAIGAPPE